VDIIQIHTMAMDMIEIAIEEIVIVIVIDTLLIENVVEAEHHLIMNVEEVLIMKEKGKEEADPLLQEDILQDLLLQEDSNYIKNIGVLKLINANNVQLNSVFLFTFTHKLHTCLIIVVHCI
jgi:hypothetical protein